MTTIREQYLLDRCLRLEAELACARGFDVPALQEKEYAPVFQRPARSYCVVTPALVAEMQALRSQGLPPQRIAFRLGCSHTTVRRYTAACGG